ncbi:MAG: hypothetical protein GY726_05185 [Proteobacteria bacterium]|nr:hypothetical protein [Pseudomonadota bacterium]
MPDLTIIYWRDIPAQVLAKQGRQRVRHKLSGRFLEGIDRAAMRAKKIDTDSYLEDWHRKTVKDSGEMETLVQETAQRLESEYDDVRLERIVKNKGIDPGLVEGAA